MPRPCSLLLVLAACGPLVDVDVSAAEAGYDEDACDHAPPEPTLLHSAEAVAVDAAGSIAIDGCRVYWTSIEYETRSEAKSLYKDGSDLQVHFDDIIDVSDLGIGGGYVFVLDRHGMVMVPQDGSEAPWRPIPTAAIAIEVGDTVAYSLEWNTLWVLDFATLSTQRIFVSTSAAAAVVGDVLYVSRADGLFAFEGPDYEGQLVAQVPIGYPLVIDEDQAYLVDGSEIVEVDLATGASAPVLVGIEGVTDVALDDDFLYWADGGSSEPYRPGSIRAWPRTGGPSIELAVEDEARGIAIDDVSVYWTTAGSGQLVRAPKPEP